MQLYRMHDSQPNGVFPVSPDDARGWNERGHGVFATVNEFDGPRRIENLRRIRAWAIDIDDGTKEQQRDLLHSSPLVPSRIVEVKRGYHAYWFAKDGKPQHWNAIVLERLVPFFGADKNARDLARILRVPGYWHLKNPSDPFLVTRRWRHDVSYTERQMAAAFPWVPNESEQRRRHEESAQSARQDLRAPVRFAKEDDFWERVYRIDCEEALRRLSGHWAVGGEHFSFRQNSNGNKNILVNGKGTSCFIDAGGHIGSLDGGGPTVAQWVRWYGNSWRQVCDVLREIYPELERAE